MHATAIERRAVPAITENSATTVTTMTLSTVVQESVLVLVIDSVFL